MKNSPGKFHLVTDVTLWTFKWNHAPEYMHEVIILLKTVDGHLGRVAAVLRILTDSGDTLNMNKYHFFTGPVDYLGHVINRGML